MIQRKYSLIAAAAVLALSGCGDNTALNPVALSSSGKAVDGYIKDATVICDANKNGLADAGEATTITNATGDFTFTPACASQIAVTGGNNIDTGLPFKGVLSAPAGSAMATPLTTIMVSGNLTSAQVAAAFGLTGTDLTTADPGKDANLLKKTLAAQQILQQSADTIGGLAKNSSPAATQAIYAEVAKAIASTVVANPGTSMVDTAGTVSTALVTSVVKASVENVANTSNSTLALAKVVVATISPTSVSELVSVAVANQAQALAKSTDIVADAKLLQANPTIANAAGQLSTLLTKAADTGSVSLSSVGTQLALLSDTSTGNDSAATANLNSAVVVVAQAASVTAPVVTEVSAPSNYLAIQGDSVSLNGTPYTLAALSSTGITLANSLSTLDSVGFTYVAKGTPIPANSNAANTARVSMGIAMTDTAASGRVLELILDQVDVTLASGVMSVTVPAGAKLYAYGKTGSGTVANLTLSNVDQDSLVSVSGNQIAFNAANVLNIIQTKVNGSSVSDTIKTTFGNLKNVKGTFNVKFAVSNLNIQAQNSPTAIKNVNISVTGSSVATLAGLGFEGKFTTAP